MYAISLTAFSNAVDLLPTLRPIEANPMRYDSENPEGDDTTQTQAFIGCMEIAFTGLVITSVLVLAAGVLNTIIGAGPIRNACIDGLGLLALFTGPSTALAVVIGLFNGRRGGEGS
jgi:hypothetical protein